MTLRAICYLKLGNLNLASFDLYLHLQFNLFETQFSSAMEQFCNLWRLGQGFAKSESQKTIELLHKILKDIQLGNANGSRTCSVVSGRFWRSIYQLLSSVDLCNGKWI